ncbi:hypothetical protein ACR9VJ_08865 [Streptomyces sp. H49]|uniref:hypothetical protein n=1 Tax=Streptomyces sp. H49 TaxID=3444117 RepID=UPI003F4A9BD6
MNQHSSTWVENFQGVAQMGGGHIYIGLGPDPQETRKPARRKVAEDQLVWLQRVLVAPRNMGEARATLAETGTVILEGAPGSGRTSAAQMLLREYRGDSGAFHELLPDEEDELPLGDPALVGAGDRLLLDLSSVDITRWSKAQADLSALREVVREQRAHLVVVMPQGNALDSGLLRFRVTIGQPDGMQVFRRHLRMHGLPYEQYMQPDAIVDEFLPGRPMREIADFADLVRRARESAPPNEGFTQWCAAARRARNDRRKEVAELVAGLHEPSQRALLISVALLHEAHADVIHHATKLLLDPQPADPRLFEGKDLAQRLSEISADTGPDGHVRFAELDHDAAVRAHFWDHMPDLRARLGTWALSVVELNDPHVTPAVRDGLVARLANQYLRTGRPEGVAALAEDWSCAPTSRAALEAAVQALTTGLNDPAHGRSFRTWLYHWCAYRRLRGEFAQVLVRVCADVLAASHPDQALLRLYYLARRELGSSLALDALHELAASTARLLRRLLDRLAQTSPAQPDLTIFLHVCDPARLTDSSATTRTLVEEKSVQRSLTTCWHAVLAELPQAVWQPRVERWFHWAADDTGHLGELLLDVLVDAAERCGERRGEAFAALYAVARAAERTAPGGSARAAKTTDLLLHKISVAQGLGPAAPSSSTRGDRP